MSTTNINLIFKVGGVLTDMQSVVFNDPTGLIGVRRTDTNANVVAPGTALNHVSTGNYSYQITDPAQGLTYLYWITYVDSHGNQFQFSQTVAGGTGNVTSPFMTYTDFINRWGLNNTIIWSQKDSYSKSNPVPNWIALQMAFDYADDEITNKFRNGPYAIPLDFTPNNGTVPPTVKEWALVLAAWQLYNSRGFEEKNKIEGRFDRLARRVYDDMSAYLGGLKMMNATYRVDVCDAANMAPKVVTVTDVFLARTNNNYNLVFADGAPVYFHL